MLEAVIIFKENTQKTFWDVISEEKGEVNIIAIVVLIGIAILLAIIFRDNVKELLSTLFSQVESGAANAIS